MNITTQQLSQHSILYSCMDETGDAKITVHTILPGIEIAFSAIHMEHFDFQLVEQKFRTNYLGIHYCKEGRIEQEINQEFFYLMSGDCSIVVEDKQIKHFELPLRHYHGISIGINIEQMDAALTAFLTNCNLPLLETMEALCIHNPSVILRSLAPLSDFFDTLYHLQNEVSILDYVKIKLPELVYILKYIAPYSLKDELTVSRTQAETVKAVANYISDHIHEKLSLKMLTVRFGVSDTYLQTAFRTVYGMPVISFIRAQKMQCAAQLLIHTTKNIGEIAQEFGYENESKFSAAFKRIMGDSPYLYRKEHSKVTIL